MKPLFFALALLSLTACSSNSTKTETPKVADEKVATTASKAVVTKPAAAAKKAEKAPEKAAVAASSPAAGAMTCTSGSDNRNIEVKTEGTGCELKYSKNGETKSIASAKNESAYCAGVSEKLVKNLTAAGFSCK